MFISITFPNIATLYEMMEAFLPSLITENLTFVQYVFLCIFYMLLQTPCANCMRGLMFIFWQITTKWNEVIILSLLNFHDIS